MIGALRYSKSQMIKLTKAAAEQVQQNIKTEKMEGLALRIAVSRNSDDSFHYILGFDETGREDDLLFKSEGVDIVISGESLILAKDMTIDFAEIEKDQFNFIFLNPNDPTYVPPTET